MHQKAAQNARAHEPYHLLVASIQKSVEWCTGTAVVTVQCVLADVRGETLCSLNLFRWCDLCDLVIVPTPCHTVSAVGSRWERSHRLGTCES